MKSTIIIILLLIFLYILLRPILYKSNKEFFETSLTPGQSVNPQLTVSPLPKHNNLSIEEQQQIAGEKNLNHIPNVPLQLQQPNRTIEKSNNLSNSDSVEVLDSADALVKANAEAKAKSKANAEAKAKAEAEAKTLSGAKEDIKANAKKLDEILLSDKFILKTQIPKCETCASIPNLNQHILKTQIPTCPKPIDLSRYILKTQIPIVQKHVAMNEYINSLNNNKSNVIKAPVRRSVQQGVKAPVRQQEKQGVRPPVQQQEKQGVRPPVQQQEKQGVRPPVQQQEKQGVRPPVQQQEKQPVVKQRIIKPPKNPVTEPPYFKSHNSNELTIEKNSYTRPKQIKYPYKCKNIGLFIPGAKVREILQPPNNCKLFKTVIRHADVYGAY